MRLFPRSRTANSGGARTASRIKACPTQNDATNGLPTAMDYHSDDSVDERDIVITRSRYDICVRDDLAIEDEDGDKYSSSGMPLVLLLSNSGDCQWRSFDEYEADRDGLAVDDEADWYGDEDENLWTPERRGEVNMKEATKISSPILSEKCKHHKCKHMIATKCDIPNSSSRDQFDIGSESDDNSSISTKSDFNDSGTSKNSPIVVVVEVEEQSEPYSMAGTAEKARSSIPNQKVDPTIATKAKKATTAAKPRTANQKVDATGRKGRSMAISTFKPKTMAKKPKTNLGKGKGTTNNAGSSVPTPKVDPNIATETITAIAATEPPTTNTNPDTTVEKGEDMTIPTPKTEPRVMKNCNSTDSAKNTSRLLGWKPFAKKSKALENKTATTISSIATGKDNLMTKKTAIYAKKKSATTTPVITKDATKSKLTADNSVATNALRASSTAATMHVAKSENDDPSRENQCPSEVEQPLKDSTSMPTTDVASEERLPAVTVQTKADAPPVVSLQHNDNADGTPFESLPYDPRVDKIVNDTNDKVNATGPHAPAQVCSCKKHNTQANNTFMNCLHATHSYNPFADCLAYAQNNLTCKDQFKCLDDLMTDDISVDPNVAVVRSLELEENKDADANASGLNAAMEQNQLPVQTIEFHTPDASVQSQGSSGQRKKATLAVDTTLESEGEIAPMSVEGIKSTSPTIFCRLRRRRSQKQ